MEDWKSRFIDEYNQLVNNIEKLHKMIVKYEAGTIEFKPNCSLELLKEQESTMRKYLYILEIRGQIEKIDFESKTK